MRFKFSLDWLLIFVPIVLLLRFVPAFSNPTALFICSAIAIIPVAGWIRHATEALAARVGEGARRITWSDTASAAPEVRRN
jgi:Ca2+:H+ antiporter